MRLISKLSIPFLAVLMLWGCKQDEVYIAIPPSGNMVLSVDNLQDLGSGFRYEGWIMYNGAPRSTGTFTVGSSGRATNMTFPVLSEALENATAFIVTIEPNPDPDPAPSATKVMAGTFGEDIEVDGDSLKADQYTAHLRIENAMAAGTDFTTAAGLYLINTPTTDTTTTDNKSGVWFIDVTNVIVGPGLSLPAPPAGWKYEGWAVIDGTPVSTGKFRNVIGSDESNQYSGPDPAPPFPGEDFIKDAPDGLTFPTNLAGETIVISVEPDPDNSPDPFILKPLSGTVPADASLIVGENYELTNQVDVNDLPSGKVLRYFGFDCTDDECLEQPTR